MYPPADSRGAIPSNQSCSKRENMLRILDQVLQEIYGYLESDKTLPEKNLPFEHKSVFEEVTPSRLRINIKVNDIFDFNPMTISYTI
jgi:hypothetical protein